MFDKLILKIFLNLTKTGRQLKRKMAEDSIGVQDAVLRDDENCPCGSGMMFSQCCKGKVDTKPTTSKKPPEVLLNERMRKSMVKCCLHPDQANCRGQIKDAHALQNHKIISLLAGNEHHVWMMDKIRQPKVIKNNEDGTSIPIMMFNKTSANKATTETCFCDLHDTVVFSAIESGAPDFDASDGEMKFVYAYKAFIFEYYKQFVAMKIYRDCFKERPHSFTDPSMVGMYRMLQKKMVEFEPIKSFYDGEIMAHTHNGVETCTIELPYKIGFATYAYVAFGFDLNGNVIQNVSGGVMHRLSVTIFPEDKKSYILLSCLTSEEKYYKSFFNQIKSSSKEKIKYYFNVMLPLFTENLVFSKELWEAQGEEGQFGITHMANLQGNDFSNLELALGMALNNASKNKHFNYSDRGAFDLFRKI